MENHIRWRRKYFLHEGVDWKALEIIDTDLLDHHRILFFSKRSTIHRKLGEKQTAKKNDKCKGYGEDAFDDIRIKSLAELKSTHINNRYKVTMPVQGY